MFMEADILKNLGLPNVGKRKVLKIGDYLIQAKDHF
jgi:hypothetical protein